MSQDIKVDRDRIRRYFRDEKRPNWKIVVAGVVIFAIGTQTHWAVTLAAIGLAWLGFKMKEPNNQATEQEVDQAIAADRIGIVERAYAKSGADSVELAHGEAAEFVYLEGRGANGIFSAGRIGQDNIYRRTPMSATVIHYGNDQLLIYKCALDLTTGNKVNEQTRMIFYRDVVSIDSQTSTESYSVEQLTRAQVKLLEQSHYRVIDGKIQADSTEQISLRLTSGESVTIAVTSGALLDSSWKSAGVDNDKELKRLRALIRQMKMAIS